MVRICARVRVLWLKHTRGVYCSMYCSVYLRGIGEYDESLHQQGINVRKQNVFDD